jgi:hypothetical protein
MLAVEFRLTPGHKDDLAVVCEVGNTMLDAIADRLDADRFTIRRSTIERTIRQIAGSEKGEVLSRILFGIAGTFRRSQSTPEEAIKGLTRALGESVTADKRFENWDKVLPAIQRLLSTRSLALAAKALDISYDFERVYLAGRLLTSIRPVFDDEREEVVGSSVVQTLRLEYVAPDGRRSNLSVALDLEDIRRLKDECERAVKKAEVARQRIQKDCNMDAIIPGEESSE